MRNDGFTLIELLVAMAVFVIILSIALGGFSGAIRSERQAIALMNSNNNSSLILEQMVREIRTGYDFCALNPCSNSVITFTNANKQNVSYRFNNNSIERGIYQNGNYNYKEITASDVFVTYLDFKIHGYQKNDLKQPFITILMGVQGREKTISGITINLQTSVSPRLLDS